MATGLLSKGITLHYDPANGTSWTALPDLQEIPEMGATVEKVEVTTLADSAKRYINGIKDYGDLVFKFLYANGVSDSYRLLAAKEATGTVASWKITLPDSTTFIFSGFPTVKVDGAGVNAPLTFSVSIALNTAISITNP